MSNVSSPLASRISRLASSCPAVAGGTATLPGGVSAVAGGTATLPGGVSAVAGGTATLPGGVSAVAGGTATLPLTATLLVLIVAALPLVSFGAGNTYHWTGDGGGVYWTNATNWAENEVPTSCWDVCVFDLASTASSSQSVKWKGGSGMFPNIRVESGTLYLSAQDGTLSLPKQSQAKMTNELYVASGATLQTDSKIMPWKGTYKGSTYEGCYGLHKTGAGAYTHTKAMGDSNGNWNLYIVHVEGGSVTINNAVPIIQHVRVRTNSWYYSSRWGAQWGRTQYRVDKGGTVRVNAYNGPKFGGVRGEGDLVVAGGYDNDASGMTLYGGPYRFSGRIYSTYTTRTVPFYITGESASGAAKHFYVCGSNTLAATAGSGKLELQSYIPLDWGAGVGEFWSMPLRGYSLSARYNLEDEAGEPITLHAGISASYASKLQITGPGNWYAWGGQTSTITGAQVSVTGTIGSDVGSTLVLGNGTDAAGDVDLAQYAGLDAKGSLTFKNVEPQTVSGDLSVGQNLTVAGPVTFASDVTAGGSFSSSAALAVGGDLTAGGAVTFGGATTVAGDVTASGAATFKGETTVTGALKAGGISVAAPTTLGSLTAGDLGNGADLTLLSGTVRGNIAVGAGTMTFENVRAYRNYNASSSYDTIYTAGSPLGVRVDGSAANSLLVVGAGSEVYAYQDLQAGSSLAMPSFTVRDGGRFVFNAAVWASNKSASSLTATLDGGTLELMSLYNQYGFEFPNSSEASKWTLVLGAKGGVIENRAAHSNGLQYHLRYTDYLTAASGVADGKDGGLTFALQATVNVVNPQRFTGPLTVKDGLLRMRSFLEDNAITYGDIVLDGGSLVLGNGLSSDLNPLLAQADGATFTYCGASHFELGQDSGDGSFSVRSVPQTYHLGPTNNAAANGTLVRGGKGSVLILSDRVNTVAVGASGGNKVFVNGGVETYANGIVTAPIFSMRDSASNFLKYDATNGFTEYADYATALDAGSDKFVKLASTATTLAEDATIAGLRLDYARNKPLTIASGATLTVGDGVHPAAIILNTVYYQETAFWQAITGAGAIDFGSSEGVLLKPFRKHSSYDAPPIVSVAIHGQNGLTVAGDPIGVNPYIELTGANDFTGGLFVDMIELVAGGASPLGVGPVTVRGRRLNGGTVGFESARTYTNDFVITGFGKNSDCFGNSYATGALHFRTSGTRLTGDVRVDEYARITANTAPSMAVNTIAGDVTGGNLQFFYGASAGKKIVLEGHNTLTGDVEIVQADIVLKGAQASLGTGEVLVDKGVLEFENTADVTFPNDMRGNGTIKLNGQSVSFTGNLNVDEKKALKVDLAGAAPTLREFPPFATITNSVAKPATVTLKGAMTIDQTKYTYLTPNMRLVLDGATVDLAGETLTVDRVKYKNGGRFTNGTVVETNPVKGTMVFLK